MNDIQNQRNGLQVGFTARSSIVGISSENKNTPLIQKEPGVCYFLLCYVLLMGSFDVRLVDDCVFHGRIYLRVSQ
mgnify:FL=1